MTRIVIAGGPRTGKTTLARYLAGELPIVHTDDYLQGPMAPTPWDLIPDLVRAAVWEAGADWVLEGAQVARTLRRYPELAKGARVYYLTRPIVRRTDKQIAMGLGVAKVWREVLRKLDGADLATYREVEAEVCASAPDVGKRLQRARFGPQLRFGGK